MNNLERIIKAKKHPRDIIVSPMFTEKSGTLMENKNAYIFKVDVKANKIEIKQAVESIFSVVVEDVNTMNFKGKVKRMGRYTGKRAAWKKAIVTLRKDYTLPGFEL